MKKNKLEKSAKKEITIMNYLYNVPDEIYKRIMEYIFLPKIELKRKTSIYRWNTNLLINKCYICTLSVKNVALNYNCGCNESDENSYSFPKCKDGCKNQLICFDCAH